MSIDRTRRLTPDELAFKLACRDAVKAAGGQDFVAEQCGRAQSRISDWCSRNTREFMPIDVIARVEALGTGAPGHPHVTRALARAQGQVLCDPEGSIPPTLASLIGGVAGESADVVGMLARLAERGLGTIEAVRNDPELRARLSTELDQLIDLASGLSALLAPPADTS